jgi:lambda family phage portal protein
VAKNKRKNRKQKQSAPAVQVVRQPPTVRVIRQVDARYDAAQIDRLNENHWAMADGFSARAANTPAVRERLRNHARYEVANNCYARGIVNTIADVTVGTGAVLQLPRGETDAEADAAKQVETLFRDWAESVDLWAKIWTARVARAQDGEAFILLRTNVAADRPVSLDLQPVEADQVTDGTLGGWDTEEIDGMEVDAFGNPTVYKVLRQHPGDNTGGDPEPVRVHHSAICHWFRIDRPGQLRGVPEITPALPLFAQLRRYTLATLTAAETAADFAGIIYTDLSPDESPTVPFRTVDIERGALLTMPDGRRIEQLKAEHPTTTYAEFKREILAEIGRALNMPRAIVLADASNYNFASGRLDRQAFDRTTDNDRRSAERQVLRKIWAAWVAEAELIPGYLPAAWDPTSRPRWLWRQLGHVDRKKEADGAAQDLANFTTTLAEECARNGLDSGDVLRQRARELRDLRELGLIPAAMAAGPDSQSAGGPATTEGDSEDVQDEQNASV